MTKDISIAGSPLRTLLSFVTLLVIPVLTSAQTNGVSLIDSINARHGMSLQNTFFSSCWGWVSPDGREYALIGTYTGTSVIDLNVYPIEEVAFIPGPTASYCYREIKTHKNYAYIVSEGGSGVQIVDLSQLPDTAILVRQFNYVGSGGRSIPRSHTVTLADGYLYLNGSAQWSPGGVVIFSLRNDPTNPEFAGEYQPQYVHDSYVKNDTMYAAAIYGGGLFVADVSDKANPQTIVQVSYLGAGTHHAWASVNGRYAFTTDEIGSTPSSLKVWDLQDLGAGPPYTPLATYQAAPTKKIHNVHGRGNYAYISHYKMGMRVVDVRDPANPTEVGWYNSYPNPDTNITYDGCWGVYPYFPSGRWIGSDMQTGLYLLNFTGLLPRTRSELLAPAVGDTVGLTGTIPFRWRLAADQSEDPHYYKVHVFGPGVDTAFLSNDTAYTLASFPGFQEAQTYRWHVWIADEFTEVSSQDTFQFVFFGPPVGVGADKPGVPAVLSLEQNYPNPFNPTTTISFNLPQPGIMTLKVYDILGTEVSVLAEGYRASGQYKVTWNAAGHPSGVYVCRLTTGGQTLSRKFILLK